MRWFFFTLLRGVVILVIMLGGMACAAEAPEADIRPVGTLEAQSAGEAALAEDEATPVVEPTAPAAPQGGAATPTPEPTATGLPTEIVEPVSPLESLPMKAQPQAVSPEGSEAAVAAAVAALAEEINLPAGQVEVTSVEAVDWNDTSLGCPQEGYMYAQVITPGYRVLLAAGGQTYEYHTDLEGTNVVSCES